MRLRSPYRNYSVDAFHIDVPEFVGMKTFRKSREISNFSMTFSSDAFRCLEGFVIKDEFQPLVLSYRKHALNSCFITSYSMIRSESGGHIYDGGLLSVSCQ